MISSNDKAAFKLMSASGAFPSDVLERALKLAETGKQSFWKNLTDISGMAESALYDVLSKQAGIPVVNLKKITIDPKALAKVPVKIAWYYKFFPYKIEDDKVWVAVAQVPDVSMLDEIRFGIGIDAVVAFAPEHEIEEMLNRHYGLGANMVNKILTQNPEKPESQSHASTSTHQVEDLEKLADTASVAQLVNQIILEAYKKRASDIHLEPFRGKIRLRYRIDGALHEAPVPPEMRKFFGPMLSRIKIMANLNVVEKRLPQDGKMRVKTQDQNLDLRISCIPTAHGESMVIRILPGKNVWSLDAIGMDPHHLNQIKQLLEKPNGIIFVTGPTGSGKSTTLYAFLTSLNAVERKIVTIEDPVEYELEGISQIQVASDIGLGFSQGLRSVLRHDPDVLMVGEVRDLETADIAIRAALTGHLILSTLHTNDAASGVTRLNDIGVEKYLIASSVAAFIAQRLVRAICPHCKEPDTSPDTDTIEQIMKSLGLAANEPVKTFHGKGCEQCNNTGYLGREAIHEILIVNDDIRHLIMQGATAGEIKKLAMQQGMQTLRQNGFRKALAGVTTPAEILKAAPADDSGAAKSLQGEGDMDAVYVPSPVKKGAAEEKESLSSLPSADNRRKYRRVFTHISVTYRILEANTQHPSVAALRDVLSTQDWNGESENISAGGLLYSSDSLIREGGLENAEITVGEAIEIGSILDLRIQLPDGQKPIHCIGRVLRMTRSLKNTDSGSKFIFHIAVLFLVINSNDRLRLEKFCEAREASA